MRLSYKSRQTEQPLCCSILGVFNNFMQNTTVLCFISLPPQQNAPQKTPFRF